MKRHARHTTSALFILAAFLLSVALAGAYAQQAPEQTFSWRPLHVDEPDRPQDKAWLGFVKLGEERARRVASGGVSDVHPIGDYYPRPAVAGDGLRLTVPRAFARPGDRWVEVFVEIAPDTHGAGRQLEARLYAVGSDQPVARQVIQPGARAGLLRVDLRRHGLSRAKLGVSLSGDGERAGHAEVFLSAQAPEHPLTPGRRVAVEVDVPHGIPADQAVPVTFGFPFPAGALWDEGGARLVNRDGIEVPGQAEVTGRWAEDGAVKWLRFDAVAVPRDGLFVEMGQAAPPAQPLTVEADDDRVVIDTGAAQYTLAKGPSPIAEIRQADRQVATADGTRGLYVIDQQGRLGVSSADGQAMTVESAGPVAACVRFEGFYRTADGEPLARHITRVETFAGRAEAKVTHTLVLSRDTNEVWFRDIGWELSVSPGAEPQAVFGVAREDQGESLTHPLDAPNASAHILQAEHFRFGAGDNRFVVAFERDGDAETLLEGEEMGDWGALAGGDAGLMFAVRDAALQHPKEFEVAADRLVMRLFSNRAGEELDFRAETLADKWNLPEYHHDTDIPVRDRVAAYESNAIGWAKTHDIVVSPLAPEAAAESAARLATINAERVYGHVDPRWIFETDALGALHPKDPENYPEAEWVVEETLARFTPLLRGQAFYGFVDYNAGPTFHPRGATARLDWERRFSSTYQFRPELWGVYARSGERDVRSFVEQTNRVFADNYMAHWDGPNKTRGLFMEGTNESPPLPHLGTGDLPFYWEDGTVFNKQDGTSLHHVVHDYYLTGNRRARDIIEQYAEGIKGVWDPLAITRRKRKVMTFRAMLHAYELTRDPDLRVLAEATASYVYDPEGATGLTKNKEVSVTYKARCAVRALIEGWRILGAPTYYDMAMRMGEHKWRRYLGVPPTRGTTSPFGIVGEFLHRETGSPVYSTWLDVSLRWAPMHPPTTQPFAASYASSGVALSQAAVERTSQEDANRVSWALWRDGDEARPVSVMVSKGNYDSTEVQVHTRGPSEAKTGEWIRPLDEPHRLRSRERSLISMQTNVNLPPGSHNFVKARVTIPKEAPGEAYEIVPMHRGEQWVTAEVTKPEVLQLEPAGRIWTQPHTWTGRAPLVLHAPEGWQTHPAPARVYFKAPEDARDGRIFFSEPTRLFTPDGDIFGQEARQGWIELPPDTPGLWSFEIGGDSRVVEVENLPPFFAFDKPESYFEPPVSWRE